MGDPNGFHRVEPGHPRHVWGGDAPAPTESYHAHVDEAVYSADQCFLQESRKSRTLSRDPLHALQFRAHPSELAGDPSDGSGCDEHAMVSHGYGDRAQIRLQSCRPIRDLSPWFDERQMKLPRPE
jgi:hypothetical protein